MINAAYYAPEALVSPTAVQFFNLPHVENPYLARACVSEWKPYSSAMGSHEGLMNEERVVFCMTAHAVIQMPLK